MKQNVKRSTWVWIFASLTFIGSLYINGMSNTGAINGETMASVSQRYFNLFVPAGYAFSIWGIIYLGMVLFLVYTGRLLVFGRNRKVSDPTLEQMLGVFSLINLFNAFWIWSWLNLEIGSSLLFMVLILAGLLRILIAERMCLDDASLSRFVFVQWPFSLYLGWIVAASIANAAAYLVAIGAPAFTGTAEWITFSILLVAGGIYSFLIWKRNTRLLALVGVWAFVAIAYRQMENSMFIGITATAMAVAVGIQTTVHGFKNRHLTPFRPEKLRE